MMMMMMMMMVMTTTMTQGAARTVARLSTPRPVSVALRGHRDLCSTESEPLGLHYLLHTITPHHSVVVVVIIKNRRLDRQQTHKDVGLSGASVRLSLCESAFHLSIF